MQGILSRDAHKLLVAPFLGLLAGFLVNRARGGEMGYALLAEMLLGGMAVTLGGVAIARLNLWLEGRAALARERLQLLAVSEAQQHEASRSMHQQAMLARAELQGAMQRIARLEAEQHLATEAASRLAVMESAQEALRQESVELNRRAIQEAEEVKASLRLAISDSTRERNLAAPQGDQSGRIIELEARIRRLAREIERLSERQPVVGEAGQASLVKPGGTQDQARIGFLKAMLDANKTLREHMKAA